jgi:hypothetical protein
MSGSHIGGALVRNGWPGDDQTSRFSAAPSTIRHHRKKESEIMAAKKKAKKKSKKK